MDYYVNQDIISYLDIDTRVITKRIYQIWNDISQQNGIQFRETDPLLLRGSDKIMYFGGFNNSLRNIYYGKSLNERCNLLWGFYGACHGGHIETVNYFIDKGIDDWNGGLTCACWNKQLEIIELMISKGATKCIWCNKEVLEHFNVKNI